MDGQNPFQQSTSSQQPSSVVVNVVKPYQKSVGVAFVLSFFFGPIGMFYSTIIGGVTMIIVYLVVGILTLGLGILICHPICIVWAIIATNNYNKDVLSSNYQR